MTLQEFIDRAGGIEPFGKALYPKTSQPKARACEIRSRGYVPPVRWGHALKLAERVNVKLSIDDLSRWRTSALRRAANG